MTTATTKIADAIATPGADVAAARRILRQSTIKTLAQSLIDAARFRVATHQHVTSIDVVAREEEGVTSTTGSVRPEALGLPHAYSKRGFWVTTSAHAWRISDAIFEPRVRDLNTHATGQCVYLSGTRRIVQGRGTSLCVEQLVRGEWVRP